jgi:hypothetical protein
MCARLGHSRKQLDPFFRFFQRLFPQDAGYQHDLMHLRDELNEQQKEVEPANADSHLTFMGAGLRNCVTYRNRPEEPVYFIELDGVFKDIHRQRRTTVLGYQAEQIVHRERLRVPVPSEHTIDSHNLKDPRYGLFERFEGWLDRFGIDKGRIEMRLAPEEQDAGLTVNEYETLLMQHDLAEVIRNPLRFMAEKSRHLLADPRAIPNKTIGYAKYDMVRVFNELLDALGLNESVVEKILARFIGAPARRFLRMKRSVSLLVSDHDEAGHGALAEGTFQSPILVQWQPCERRERSIDVTLTRFR